VVSRHVAQYSDSQPGIRSGRSRTQIYLRPGRSGSISIPDPSRSGLEAPESNPVPPGRVRSDLLPGLRQIDYHYRLVVSTFHPHKHTPQMRPILVAQALLEDTVEFVH
jgi:hypothetical protein